ncbi:MAG: hypothetical protein HUJ65_03485 [Oscillospiraceae bacterium]|nr:hypothetical protein [Oscillospiraceae bacterium]
MDNTENTVIEELTSASEETAAVEADRNESPVKSGGSVVMTVAASVIGMIVGILIPTLGAVIFGGSVPILYLAIPICICAAIALFGGNRRAPALAAAIVFSGIGVYLAFTSCRAAEYVLGRNMSILSIPVLAISAIGGSQTLQSVKSQSAYLFPAVFAAIGAACSWLTLFKSEKV